MSRIVSYSGIVCENIYFPDDWYVRWPKFYVDISSFKKEGGNRFDDAPDALTGIAEKLEKMYSKHGQDDRESDVRISLR